MKTENRDGWVNDEVARARIKGWAARKRLGGELVQGGETIAKRPSQIMIRGGRGGQTTKGGLKKRT